MQLDRARLCLNCDEVHDEARCPACASDRFVFLTRWVAADRRVSAPVDKPPDPDVTDRVRAYRRLTAGEAVGSKAGRLMKRGAVGLAIFSLARWAWRRHRDRS